MVIFQLDSRRSWKENVQLEGWPCIWKRRHYFRPQRLQSIKELLIRQVCLILLSNQCFIKYSWNLFTYWQYYPIYRIGIYGFYEYIRFLSHWCCAWLLLRIVAIHILLNQGKRVKGFRVNVQYFCELFGTKRWFVRFPYLTISVSQRLHTRGRLSHFYRA